MAENDYQDRLKNTGRNDPCPCGSGKKYKKCHLDADEQSRSKAIATTFTAAQQAAKAAEPGKEEHSSHPEAGGHKKGPVGGVHQAKPGMVTKQVSSPRKVGG